MIARNVFTLLLAAGAFGLAVGLSGCDGMPGRPKLADKWQAPDEMAGFEKLYSQNCVACHGLGSVAGASIAMDNPTFLAVIPGETLTNDIANGVHGTAMPGSSKAAGGTLTAEQIKTITAGILAKNRPGRPARPFRTTAPRSATLAAEAGSSPPPAPPAMGLPEPAAGRPARSSPPPTSVSFPTNTCAPSSSPVARISAARILRTAHPANR